MRASIVAWAACVMALAVPASAVGGSCDPDRIAARSGWHHIDIISNKPFVTVRLNNSRPLNFVLDAGSPWTIIDRGLADELGFRPASDSVQVGGFAPSFEPRACVRVLGVTLSDIRIGEIELDHVSSVEGVRIDGLVGGELFEKYIVLIDYPRSSARVYPASYNYRGDGVVLPLDIQRLAFCEAQLVAPDGNYVPGTFIFDTGVRMPFLLNEPYVERHGWLHGQNAVRGMTVGLGVRGETQGDLFMLREVKVGNLRVPNVVAIASRDSVVLDPTSDDAGILGGDFMRRFRLWMDYPHHRAILEPTHELNRPFEYDRSGMFLLSEGENFRTIRVRRVAPRSPADIAGVLAGDRLISINGQLTERLGLEETRRLLREDNRRQRVLLERDGRRFKLEFVTMDLLESKAASLQ
ncbi:MAG TPA: aspartyl protease family protein [Candidatus Krumholzibacteria bacterium]